MKESLRPGISGKRRLVVERSQTIDFMGEEGRVYGTPDFGLDVELACRDILLAHCDPGEDSVGIEITLRHTAATLPGMEVEISATVTAVEGRKVSLEFTARDELEPIGGGTHTRFVVDVAKTFERLKAKAARRAASKAT
jgi:predicted thioesterase